MRQRMIDKVALEKEKSQVELQDKLQRCRDYSDQMLQN